MHSRVRQDVPVRGDRLEAAGALTRDHAVRTSTSFASHAALKNDRSPSRSKRSCHIRSWASCQGSSSIARGVSFSDRNQAISRSRVSISGSVGSPGGGWRFGSQRSHGSCWSSSACHFKIMPLHGPTDTHVVKVAAAVAAVQVGFELAQQRAEILGRLL